MKLSVWASHYRAEWHGSGQIPSRAIRAGLIDRFGSIDPNEGGITQRTNLNADYSWQATDVQRLTAHAYASYYALSLFNDFTLFLNDPEHGDMIKKYNAQYFMISVDPLEGEQGNKAFAEAQHADFPLLSDPSKAIATDYGVLSERGFANRWTFYIGKDGKISGIDKQVKPATSAEDMAAMLKQLGTEERKKK